ncbi:type II toxin-antitoxin system VapC family toxin [Tautonia rosea]|uniref:type II toxin-antitoxin system VapC family toxin n=1 Tax=Tautonia rosea TaxID=2728037 RepID=UPI001475B9D1|nr:type II toxin-antitoxin system VapC family toxin [Tautonia rosea]
MKLLLDTRALLTWLDDPALMQDEARLAIANGRNTVYASAVSMQEIALKASLGLLDAPEDLAGSLEACRFTGLPLTVAHAAAIRSLPPIHHDPFDRALIAQAKAEGLTIVTSDATICRYDVPVLAA